VGRRSEEVLVRRLEKSALSFKADEGGKRGGIVEDMFPKGSFVFLKLKTTTQKLDTT